MATDKARAAEVVDGALRLLEECFGFPKELVRLLVLEQIGLPVFRYLGSLLLGGLYPCRTPGAWRMRS
jgi:hypothetical protein